METRANILLVSKVASFLARSRKSKYEKIFGELRKDFDLHVICPAEPGVTTSFESDVHLISIKSPSFLARKLYYKSMQKEAAKPETRQASVKNSRSGIFKKLSYFLFPDSYIDSSLISVFAALWTVKKYRCKVIVTTIFPFSLLLPGLVVKMLFPRIRWVVEMRDPYANNPFNEKPDLINRMDRALERACLKRCDEIWIFKGWFPSGKQYFRNYPDEIYDKVVEHPMLGYDATIFKPRDVPRPQDKPLTIVHAGNFYGGDYSPDLFLQAVAAAREGFPGLEIEVSFYGESASSPESLPDGIKVVNHGYVDYTAIGEALGEADVLLWLAGESTRYDDNLPSKLFDYLGADRPIFAVLPEGKSREFADAIGIEFIASPQSKDDIVAALNACYAKWQRRELSTEAYRVNLDDYSIQAALHSLRNSLKNLLNR